MRKNVFVEPCPGCFENQLLELFNQPGNPLFLGNGDFTLSRLLEAAAKLVRNGDLIVTLYYLDETTLTALENMINGGDIRSASLIYDVTDSLPSEGSSIHCIHYPVRAGILSLKSDKRQVMIAGNLTQKAGSGSLECFTMVNDPDTRDAIWRQLKRKTDQ